MPISESRSTALKAVGILCLPIVALVIWFVSFITLSNNASDFVFM
jgi:hypothetical protein